MLEPDEQKSPAAVSFGVNPRAIAKAPMEHNLSIMLIAHNEEQNVGAMIGGLLKNYDKEILEIVVVDDCSQDRTAAIVKEWQARDPRVKVIERTPPPGVGRALRTGFVGISPAAEFALSMDSDFISNIPEVRRLIEAMEKNDCDGVIGSRFIPGSRMEMYPWIKKLMNRAFTYLAKLVFLIRQNDLSNNFKLYRTEIFKTLPWKSDTYAMNAETGILPIVAGYRIIEAPISWIGRSSEMGLSKFHLFREGWGYLKVIFYAWSIKRSIKIKR
jgi:dolichol-phosphate mannosyltransferase